MIVTCSICDLVYHKEDMEEIDEYNVCVYCIEDVGCVAECSENCQCQ